MPSNLDQMYELAERLHGTPIPYVQMTQAQFERWSGPRLPAEWIDGHVLLLPANTPESSSLTLWLVTLLARFIEHDDFGSVYLNRPMRLRGQKHTRLPDITFFHGCSPKSGAVGTREEGAPDLLIEILSPDNQSRDRREKYLEYEKAGVREYWIVDPLSKTVEASRIERKKTSASTRSAG